VPRPNPGGFAVLDMGRGGAHGVPAPAGVLWTCARQGRTRHRYCRAHSGRAEGTLRWWWHPLRSERGSKPRARWALPRVLKLPSGPGRWRLDVSVGGIAGGASAGASGPLQRGAARIRTVAEALGWAARVELNAAAHVLRTPSPGRVGVPMLPRLLPRRGNGQNVQARRVVRNPREIAPSIAA
jgi:hypothetical protein